MHAFIKKCFSLSNLWLLGALMIVGANIKHLAPAYTARLSAPARPLPAPGALFEEFKPFLKNARVVGFLTDKDMSPERNDGVFLMAQYALAPVTLELNNAEHELLLIDPAHMLSAMDLTQSIPVEFIHVASNGRILARRK